VRRRKLPIGWRSSVSGNTPQRFVENEITLSILPDLTGADLKELGVSALGHRRLLLRAIAALDNVKKRTLMHTTAAPAPVTPQQRDSAERRLQRSRRAWTPKTSVKSFPRIRSTSPTPCGASASSWLAYLIGSRLREIRDVWSISGKLFCDLCGMSGMNDGRPTRSAGLKSPKLGLSRSVTAPLWGRLAEDCLRHGGGLSNPFCPRHSSTDRPSGCSWST
jgi:SAM domain (Sterile alpha motif)